MDCSLIASGLGYAPAKDEKEPENYNAIDNVRILKCDTALEV